MLLHGYITLINDLYLSAVVFLKWMTDTRKREIQGEKSSSCQNICISTATKLQLPNVRSRVINLPFGTAQISKSAALSSFQFGSGTVSHDLKNPFTGNSTISSTGKKNYSEKSNVLYSSPVPQPNLKIVCSYNMSICFMLIGTFFIFRRFPTRVLVVVVLAHTCTLRSPEGGGGVGKGEGDEGVEVGGAGKGEGDEGVRGKE